MMFKFKSTKAVRTFRLQKNVRTPYIILFAQQIMIDIAILRME